MPSIFTPTPAETERKEPGHGGRPPVDRRPTGGGGGGGDDDWRSPRRGPREMLHRARALLFCALAGDMMFFVVLVALFYARQSGTTMDARTLRQIGDWHPVLLPPILFLNTAALVLSCLTMEVARLQIFREFDVLEEWLGLGRPAVRRAVPWLGATLALGLLFLLIKERTIEGSVQVSVQSSEVYYATQIPVSIPRAFRFQPRHFFQRHLTHTGIAILQHGTGLRKLLLHLFPLAILGHNFGKAAVFLGDFAV